MAFWQTLLLALALAVDDLGVGVSLGAARREGSRWLYVRCALVMAAFQTLMPVLGWAIGMPLAVFVERWAHWIAFALLGYAAYRMIREALEGEEESEFLDIGRWRTLVYLGVATSLDQLAVGLSLGIAGKPILLLAILGFVITAAVVLSAVFLGNRVNRLLGQRAPLVGGIVLLYIGVRILIEGLAA